MFIPFVSGCVIGGVVNSWWKKQKDNGKDPIEVAFQNIEKTSSRIKEQIKKLTKKKQ